MESNFSNIMGECKLKVDFPKEAGNCSKYIEKLKTIENETGISLKILVQMKGNPEQLKKAHNFISEIKDLDKVNLMADVDMAEILKTILSFQNTANTIKNDLNIIQKEIQELKDANRNNTDIIQNKISEEIQKLLLNMNVVEQAPGGSGLSHHEAQRKKTKRKRRGGGAEGGAKAGGIGGPDGLHKGDSSVPRQSAPGGSGLSQHEPQRKKTKRKRRGGGAEGGAKAGGIGGPDGLHKGDSSVPRQSQKKVRLNIGYPPEDIPPPPPNSSNISICSPTSYTGFELSLLTAMASPPQPIQEVAAEEDPPTG